MENTPERHSVVISEAGRSGGDGVAGFGLAHISTGEPPKNN
jgi:hypothetical protein